MPGRAYDALFALAIEQFGYVTREQALAAGFAGNALREMAQRGVVTHVDHGVYRFDAFPPGPHDAYMEAVLWPHRKMGVLSHETALDLYGLSDANPARIHITVPKKHRVTRKVPTVYEIHHADLKPDEVMWREGLPLTTIERTIRDCHQTHLRRGLLEQALDQARARGLINATTERKLRKEITEPVAAEGAQ
jgi:predicted transcriptional regulator of viral defense system